jgi:putative nucleotidyltransferase with HDIG domain
MVQDIPTDAECFRLLSQRGTPQPVVEHCRAVAAKADELAAALIKQGVQLDSALIHAGALLHDIAKGSPGHAKLGAAWLVVAGYPRVAKIVADHEFLPEPIVIDESAVVNLADKLIQGTKEVSLEERFANSLEKCQTDAAVKNHEKRARQAFALENMLVKIS